MGLFEDIPIRSNADDQVVEASWWNSIRSALILALPDAVSGFLINENDMASNSTTQAPTQSSVKAYADTKQEKSALTTKGDIYVATADSTITRVGVGSNNQVLTADSAEASGVKWANPGAGAPPVVTKYSSGSGTFSLTGTPLYLRVIALGGGGGGGGSGTSVSGGTGGTGGTTTFGTSLLTANGGVGGGPVAPGAGGSSTISGVGIGDARTGNTGGFGNFEASGPVNLMSGVGASSPYGSGGLSADTSTGAGITAGANSGAGGGGASKPAATANFYSGGGGGSGGYIDAIIPNPSGTYAYAVGAGGSAGAAGTSGAAGGAGGSGVIIVMEYYQ